MEEKPRPSNEESGQSSNTVSNFLQAPRRKRKNYIIMALGKNFSEDIAADIESYARKAFPALAFSNPANPIELSRQFGRNISLLIISDDFESIDTIIDLVKTLKEKRRTERIPVLFLTKNAKSLVEKYHAHLASNEPIDDFIQYPGVARYKIFSAIKVCVDQKTQKKIKRYSISIPITMFHLTLNRDVEAELLELTLHSAVILSKEGLQLTSGDQLLLKMPAYDLAEHNSGDFFKISAKVRKVFITGNTASVSFEHLTEYRIRLLSQFLTAMVGHQLERKARARVERAKGAQD
jgi:hypothetical protein